MVVFWNRAIERKQTANSKEKGCDAPAPDRMFAATDIPPFCDGIWEVRSQHPQDDQYSLKF